ncbi:VanZ family protein [Enterocloster citroniae]|uniref:VanZ family protein n=1 Tax=Enterocloster citroniae TaxID=358743 RepID=UPI0022E22EF2|nr:VanZ family protein [Enterocloster citroniae]
MGILIGLCSIKFLGCNKRCLKCTLLIIYFIMLSILTIFEREPGSRTEMCLTLFGTIGGPRDNSYVIENVLLFIPFGILAPWTWRLMRNPVICTLFGFALSCTVEVIQLITQRGYFQVDDIFTNTIGTLIGAVVFWIFTRMAGYD